MEKYEVRLLQDLSEFNQFLKWIRGWGIRNYLEIGCKYGASVWRIAQQLPQHARIVGVDLPHGDASFKDTLPHLQACFATLKAKKYDAHLLIGDSTDPGIIEQVRALSPFDLCFIDANHTEPYVRSDWKHYGEMAPIIAFHDIGWVTPPDYRKMPIHVPIVWNELKQQFKHAEIKRTPGHNGIGVLWRNEPQT
jgi:predicted O-methyltransferase YrrM